MAARTIFVGPSCILRSTGMPRASSASAIRLPSSAPSVSSFEATTTGRAAAWAAPCRAAAVSANAKTTAGRSATLDRRSPSRRPCAGRDPRFRCPCRCPADPGLPHGSSPWAAGPRDDSGRIGDTPCCNVSERDREQRVDLAAVEHDILPHEPPATLTAHDPVDIAAGREQDHLAVLHRAYDDETCFGVERAVPLAGDAKTRDDVPIALRLVDIRVAQGADPIVQHVLRGRVDQPERQSGVVILGRGDAVAAILGEEIRPAFERVAVEAVGIGGVEILQFEPPPNLGEVHRPHASIIPRQACQKPRTEASVARVSCDSWPNPPISITEHSSSAPGIARWIKPPTAPSSIET